MAADLNIRSLNGRAKKASTSRLFQLWRILFFIFSKFIISNYLDFPAFIEGKIKICKLFLQELLQKVCMRTQTPLPDEDTFFKIAVSLNSLGLALICSWQALLQALTNRLKFFLTSSGKIESKSL